MDEVDKWIFPLDQLGLEQESWIDRVTVCGERRLIKIWLGCSTGWNNSLKLESLDQILAHGRNMDKLTSIHLGQSVNCEGLHFYCEMTPW